MLRIEHLYLVAALALGGFVVALLPIVPHDFWWHMAIGRDIARTGAIPRVDTYSWSMPAGTPFVYQSWLSELIFYRIYSLGGLPAIVWLRNILFVASLGVLALDAHRRSGSWRLAALAVAGVTTLVLNNLTMRPQSLSWLPFVLTWSLLGSYRAGQSRARWLLAIPVMMALWVNLHGAFVLGIVLVGLTALGESLRLLLRQDTGDAARTAGSATPFSGQARVLWMLLLLTVLATLANPLGPGVFGYVRTLLGSSPVQSLVIEWQPINVMSFAGIVFVLTLLLGAGLWLRSRRAINLPDLLVWAGLLWLAAGGVRSIIWWAMIAWPIIAGLLSANAVRRARPLPARLVNTVLALLLLLLPLSVQPPFKRFWPLPPVFAGLGRDVPNGPLISKATPVQASAWLRQHPLPPGSRLFNDLGYGSYLIWALPDIPVYVDPRIELYPLDQWQRYKRITAACNYNRELRELGVTHLMLDRNGEQELIMALETDRAWQQLYDDPQTIIYERTAAGASNDACVTF